MHTPDGGGRTLYTIYLGPAKVELFADDAAKLAMTLVEMLGKGAETFTRTIVLEG